MYFLRGWLHCKWMDDDSKCVTYSLLCPLHKGTCILRLICLLLCLPIWDNTVVKQVTFIILLQHVLLLQWHAYLAILDTWRKSEMAELMSRDKICGGKSLLFLQIIECFSRMCRQSLPQKDEILFPSWVSPPFIVLYIIGIPCSEGVCCQVYFSCILCLAAVTRCNGN